MKFNEYVYKRPNLENLSNKVNEYVEKIKSSKNVEEVLEIVKQMTTISKDIDTYATLCSIRNSVDTTDEFYEKEQEYFDNNLPIYSEAANNYLLALYNSPFRKELEAVLGEYLFKKIEVELKTFSPEIISDLQEENKLCTEYSKLIASAKIEFDGKINNLPQMSPYLNNTDRNIRKQANDLVAKFLGENSSQFDDIYDRMIKVRTTMAKKLGFENYVELGYYRLGRTDYDQTMVANYRKQIKEEVLPIVKKIYQDQAKRIGVEDMKNYDLNLGFLSGNPSPKGNREWMVNHAKTMYHEMSKETGEFIDFMTEHELLDLDAKPGKRPGGYCTFIANYASPFIFANFNGTSGDVDVLTHEAGHAFQVFSCRNFDVLEYMWPTYEACEIHSMSMEFFARPWIHLFFEEDTDKYLYSHLVGTITFLPYGVCVDEFQHEVYNNPDMSKEERTSLWRRLEEKYMPFKVYDNDILNRGTWWYRQSHIFTSPFYYIDYTLAQVCAQQFFILNEENHEKAWNKYYELCCLGGSKSFLGLLEASKLENPFVDGTVKNVMDKLNLWLENFDQSKLK